MCKGPDLLRLFWLAVVVLNVLTSKQQGRCTEVTEHYCWKVKPTIAAWSVWLWKEQHVPLRGATVRTSWSDFLGSMLTLCQAESAIWACPCTQEVLQKNGEARSTEAEGAILAFFTRWSQCCLNCTLPICTIGIRAGIWEGAGRTKTVLPE